MLFSQHTSLFWLQRKYMMYFSKSVQQFKNMTIILRRHYVIRGPCEIAQPASSAQCVLNQWSIWWFYLISLPVLEIEESTMPTDVVTIKSGRHFWKLKVTWSIGEITNMVSMVLTHALYQIRFSHRFPTRIILNNKGIFIFRWDG